MESKHNTKKFIKPRGKGTREEKRNREQLQSSQKTMAIKYITFRNYFKCKWTKIFNQKTQ